MSDGDAWEKAVVEGALPLAIIRAGGLWERLNVGEQAVVMKAAVGQSREVLRAALPILLAELAGRIEKRGDANRREYVADAKEFGDSQCEGVSHWECHAAAAHRGIYDARDIVRGFAIEVQL